MRMRKLLGIFIIAVLFCSLPAAGIVYAEERIAVDALRGGVVLCNDGSAPRIFSAEGLFDSKNIELAIEPIQFADLLIGSDEFTLIADIGQHRCEVNVSGAQGRKNVTVSYDGATVEPVAVLTVDRFSVRIGTFGLSVAEQEWRFPFESDVGVSLSFRLDRYRYDQNPDPVSVKVVLTEGALYVSEEEQKPAADDDTNLPQDSESDAESKPSKNPESDSENKSDSVQGSESDSEGSDSIHAPESPKGDDEAFDSGSSLVQVEPSGSVNISGERRQDSEQRRAVPWLCAGLVVLILTEGVMFARLKSAAHGMACRDSEEH